MVKARVWGSVELSLNPGQLAVHAYTSSLTWLSLTAPHL